MYKDPELAVLLTTGEGHVKTAGMNTSSSLGTDVAPPPGVSQFDATSQRVGHQFHCDRLDKLIGMADQPAAEIHRAVKFGVVVKSIADIDRRAAFNVTPQSNGIEILQCVTHRIDQPMTCDTSNSLLQVCRFQSCPHAPRLGIVLV
jgi:hypothetical protein